MFPTINFHNIASIQFQKVTEYTRSTDGVLFWARTMTVTNLAGERFDMGLFGDLPDSLLLPGEIYPEREKDGQIEPRAQETASAGADTVVIAAERPMPDPFPVVLGGMVDPGPIRFPI